MVVQGLAGNHGEKMQVISEFERSVFNIRNRLLYIPCNQLLTIDNDLMESRSQSNHIK